MSVEITRKGNQDYAYFYPGRGGKIYLGNVTDKKKPQIKIDKVLESLDYIKEKFSHYDEIEAKLVSFLPPEKKDQYISKRIDELYKIIDKHTLSLSPSVAKQYKSKGQEKAEEETRLRSLPLTGYWLEIGKYLDRQYEPSEIARLISEFIVETNEFNNFDSDTCLLLPILPLPGSAIIKKSKVKNQTPENINENDFLYKDVLINRRLGSISETDKCLTCKKQFPLCVGHLGYIELSQPVLNLFFVANIFDILRVSCRECSKITIPKRDYEIMKKHASNQDKIRTIIELADDMEYCLHCGTKKYKISFEIDPVSFFHKTEKGMKRILPSEIKNWFSKIDETDRKFLGYNPDMINIDDFIMTILPIFPIVSGNKNNPTLDKRMNKMLTVILLDLIKENNLIQSSENSDFDSANIDRLQYYVWNYVSFIKRIMELKSPDTELTKHVKSTIL